MEASFGLGDALVSGLVNADVYKVRDGEVIATMVATKQRAIHAARGDFIRSLPDEGPGEPVPGVAPAPIETDPALVTELIAHSQASIAPLKRDIRNKSGSALLDFILADIQELRRILFDPQSHQVIMAAMQTAWWLNEQLQEWLGEKNAADTLTQSVPHNVTSEMGLALLDVADVADLGPGDILVTAHTDPSWTPLFVAIKGLVTEVGGLMTHGAVIAREYGLPAVVGVEHATRLIRDGQQIRVHGTSGYVEILLQRTV